MAVRQSSRKASAHDCVASSFGMEDLAWFELYLLLSITEAIAPFRFARLFQADRPVGE